MRAPSKKNSGDTYMWGSMQVYLFMAVLLTESERRNNRQLRVFCFDSFVKPVVTLFIDGAPVFVADFDVFQRKRPRVSVFNTPAAPVGRAIAQCIIDGVERIGDEEIQFCSSGHASPTAAWPPSTGVADEHGSGPDVFAELEKFVVSRIRRYSGNPKGCIVRAALRDHLWSLSI